jgi:predicted PurR-regulated permease PerM
MLHKNDDSLFNRQFAFFTLLLFGVVLCYLLRDFFTPFLGAVIFYVMFKPLMVWLVQKKKWNKVLVIVLIILLSLTIIIIPTLILINSLYVKITHLVNNPTDIINTIELLNEKIKWYAGIDIFSDQTIQVLKEKLGSVIPSLLNKMLGVFGQLLIMYFLLFYLLFYFAEIPAFLRKNLPLESHHINVFINELDSMTLSNVIGAPALAVIQAISAILAFYFFNVPEPIFWGIMCGVFSFIPFVGSALIWLPAVFLLLSTNQNWQGMGLLTYGVIVISNVDNVFRFVLQKKFANVHPLITVFGVIIGIQLFGLPGFIFGPLLISYFILGVKIYQSAYKDKTHH